MSELKKIIQEEVGKYSLTDDVILDIIKSHTIKELVNYDWDILAFGFSSETFITIPIKKIHIKYKMDMENVIGFSMHKYFNDNPNFKHLSPIKSFNDLPPIEVSYEKGKFWIEEGHHRYGYALELGLKKVKVFIESIRDNPFNVLGFDIDDVIKMKQSLLTT